MPKGPPAKVRHNNTRNYVYSIDSSQGLDSQSVEDDIEEAYTLFSVVEDQSKAPPMMVTVQLNYLPFHMEVDTGASISVAGEAKLPQLLGNLADLCRRNPSSDRPNRRIN